MAEDTTRQDLAIRVAWLYHDRGLTQQEIADRLGLSRSSSHNRSPKLHNSLRP